VVSERSLLFLLGMDDEFLTVLPVMVAGQPRTSAMLPLLHVGAQKKLAGRCCCASKSASISRNQSGHGIVCVTVKSTSGGAHSLYIQKV
jgi:hypothetical protein